MQDSFRVEELHEWKSCMQENFFIVEELYECDGKSGLPRKNLHACAACMHSRKSLQACRACTRTQENLCMHTAHACMRTRKNLCMHVEYVGGFGKVLHAYSTRMKTQENLRGRAQAE